MERQFLAVAEVRVTDIGQAVLLKGALQVDCVVRAKKDLVSRPLEQVLALGVDVRFL